MFPSNSGGLTRALFNSGCRRASFYRWLCDFGSLQRPEPQVGSLVRTKSALGQGSDTFWSRLFSAAVMCFDAVFRADWGTDLAILSLGG